MLINVIPELIVLLSEYSCISLSFFIIAVWNSLSCSSVFRDFELASGDFPFAIWAVALVAQDIPWIASLSRHRGGSVLCSLCNCFAPGDSAGWCLLFSSKWCCSVSFGFLLPALFVPLGSWWSSVASVKGNAMFSVQRWVFPL